MDNKPLETLILNELGAASFTDATRQKILETVYSSLAILVQLKGGITKQMPFRFSINGNQQKALAILQKCNIDDEDVRNTTIKVAMRELSAEEQSEMSVGIGHRISEFLTPQQLAEFDAISEPQDVERFLQEHVPTYRQIVLEERRRIVNGK